MGARLDTETPSFTFGIHQHQHHVPEGRRKTRRPPGDAAQEGEAPEGTVSGDGRPGGCSAGHGVGRGCWAEGSAHGRCPRPRMACPGLESGASRSQHARGPSLRAFASCALLSQLLQLLFTRRLPCGLCIRAVSTRDRSRRAARGFGAAPQKGVRPRDPEGSRC